MDKLQDTIKSLEKEKRDLIANNRVMGNILKTNVYPEVENELLLENKLLTCDDSFISEEGKASIIDDHDTIKEIYVLRNLLSKI